VDKKRHEKTIVNCYSDEKDAYTFSVKFKCLNFTGNGKQYQNQVSLVWEFNPISDEIILLTSYKQPV